MEWTKVTPETMPPGSVLFMATVRNIKTGAKFLLKDVVYHPIAEYYAYTTDGAESNVLDAKHWEVTHWMHYPEPAKD